LRHLVKKNTDKNSSNYWDARWSLHLREDDRNPLAHKGFKERVSRVMNQYDCENVLEIGCGPNPPLIGLPNVTHLDFSFNALKESGLDSFIYADITKHIPVPDKTFDATFSCACLMHLSKESLPLACAEIQRVTKKVLITQEAEETDLKRYFDSIAVVSIINLMVQDKEG